jgi:uncharacterized OB-fold protein
LTSHCEQELVSFTPKIWCDKCAQNTVQYTKIFGKRNVTNCTICDDKTEWIEGGSQN